MRALYRELAVGSTPVQALQAAQGVVRAHPQWGHPYYWAGFQLMGAWE